MNHALLKSKNSINPDCKYVWLRPLSIYVFLMSCHQPQRLKKVPKLIWQSMEKKVQLTNEGLMEDVIIKINTQMKNAFWKWKIYSA